MTFGMHIARAETTGAIVASTGRRFRTLARTRWGDVCLFGPATCIAIAIVTVQASLATGALPADVIRAAERVASDPVSWVCVFEAALVTVFTWHVMRGHITISMRRSDSASIRERWW
jgi:hypothetical protein